MNLEIKETLLLITVSGHLMALALTQKDITSQTLQDKSKGPVFNTLTGNLSTMFLEKRFWTMLGRDTTAVCLPTVKQGQESHTQ